MDFITKEKFEAFVQKEFPGKEFHWDYNDGRGYMSIQAGNGKKFSFPDIHYEYYNGQVRVHIEGEHWWWLRHELSYILKRHDELRGEVWLKRQDCQWILESQKNDIFELFKRIRDIVEPELFAYENGEKLNDNSKDEPVTFEEYNANDIYTLHLNIPKYQRIYTWGYEQVKTLLDDIANIHIDKYYIGSVILHKQIIGGKETYDIVDGQQRLVTIALIKYEILKRMQQPSSLPKGLDSFLNCGFASLEAHINISDNLQTIKNYLSDDIRYKKIAENIDKLTFSVLTIKNKDNLDLAFTFFSNTNSKGKKLTDYDLLKPHHLRYIPSDLEDQQMHLAAKWDKMINDGRSIEADNEDTQDYKEYISYIRVMELLLYRIRNWEQYNNGNESEDHHIKKEFEASPIINEIPPFGEQFHFGEPIQGGQHFFAYVDFFISKYNKFSMKGKLQHYFGKSGTNAWYGTVIEALVFCYYLKFGESYINEATMSITRYISIIRFRLGRAYKPTIIDWARRSKVVMDINRATSPSFFLASIEKKIDNPSSDPNKLEEAATGVRKRFLENCCHPLTHDLMKETMVSYYKNYYNDRYGKFS